MRSFPDIQVGDVLIYGSNEWKVMDIEDNLLHLMTENHTRTSTFNSGFHPGWKLSEASRVKRINQKYETTL